jgi:hypothetical protein
MSDPVSKVKTNLCFRTAYDNGGDVARICCDVTFTSLARSHWRQEHRPCDADSLPCLMQPSSAAVVLIQRLPLLSHLPKMASDTVLQRLVIIFVFLFIIDRDRTIAKKKQANSRVQSSAFECGRVRSSAAEACRVSHTRNATALDAASQKFCSKQTF